MSEPSWSPGPTRTARVAARRSSVNSEATSRTAMIRRGAVQRWPVVPKPAATEPLTARSRSASSSTMTALWPPISACTFLPSGAAFVLIPRPVCVEPEHEVDDAVRDACVNERSHELDRAERRQLRRLEHDGVAADERARELPARNVDGKVPGRDQADDAERLAERHRHHLVGLRGRGHA